MDNVHEQNGIPIAEGVRLAIIYMVTKYYLSQNEEQGNN